MKYPELFCSIVSHSGALSITKRRADGIREDLQVEFPLIFGDTPSEGPDCLYGIADRADPAILPRIRIDFGTEDGLLEDSGAFHQHLESLEIEHEYQEFPGAHTWDYCDRHIQDAIAFHRESLRI
jgi:putative tributyrin esterase